MNDKYAQHTVADHAGLFPNARADARKSPARRLPFFVIPARC